VEELENPYTSPIWELTSVFITRSIALKSRADLWREGEGRAHCFGFNGGGKTVKERGEEAPFVSAVAIVVYCGDGAKQLWT